MINEEKVSKKFKTSSIINSILLIITLFCLCSALLYDSPNELVAFAATLMFFSFCFWSFIFSLISFVFTVIYGIDNYKTTFDFSVKKKIKIILIILGIIHFLLLLLFVI